jgi:hypothetical protein
VNEWRDVADKVLEALASRPGIDPLLVEEFRARFAMEPDVPPPDEFDRASQLSDQNRSATARFVDFYSAVQAPLPSSGVAIEVLDGLTPAEATSLRGAGVGTTVELLAAAGPKAGRRALSRATGIPLARLLRWVNHADLLRVRGTTVADATILEAAGVDSVPELGHRNAEKLAALIAPRYAANHAAPPGVSVVSAWIDDASGRLPSITY